MPVDVVQRAQQLRQRAALTAVDAVERGVLRDQQQLLHALRGELVGFLDDRVDRPAAVVAAHLGDDAERALVVAAFGNLHVRVVAGRDALARR